MLAGWSSISRSHFHSNEDRRGVSRIVEDCFDHLCLTVSGLLPIPSSVNKLKREAGGAKEAPTQEHAIDSTATHFILHFIRDLHT